LKKLLLIPLILLLNFSASAQNISASSIALKNIGWNLKLTDLPDSLESVKLLISGEDYSQSINLNLKNGAADTSIVIAETGNFDLSVEGFPGLQSNIRILPGILSILPPLIAIVLALIFRQIIVSLLIGIFSGVLFIYNYNPLTAILKLIDTEIIKALNDESHIQILIFTYLFGGLIGLIFKSGGTHGIANLITQFARTRKSSVVSSWLSGLIIFFDDYANTLIVGNLMRPITDKMRVSREKLSFIVDATAAPVASVFIVSSWIGFEIGLIQDGLNAIGSLENAYDVFIQTIPYRFYPIAMLIFVLMIALSNRDFGPMYKAEKRAVDENKVLRDNAEVASEINEAKDMFGNEDKAKWYNGIIPLAFFIIVTIVGLIYTGIDALNEQGISDYSVREVIGNSNSYVALLWSSFTSCVVAAVMILSQKILTLKETVDAWFTGIRSMFYALIVLTLAWTIGSVTQDLNTADYIASVINEAVDPRFLPVLVFLVCAIISFATGTSWGTMAIMMPIVIPLAASISAVNNYSPADTTLILHGVISSVLAGAVFGDHCSPISDTTILSAMASGCDLMDHVRTQLPYAILTAIVCMLIGDIPTAYGFSPYLSILIISGVLAGILFMIGRKHNYVPTEL